MCWPLKYDISGCELKIAQTEKGFGALLRSMRKNLIAYSLPRTASIEFREYIGPL
jgi:hypothetical protein